MMAPRMDDHRRRHRTRRRAVLISVAVGFAMLAIKMGAYLATGSATILSDALESVVHVFATVFMFVCFRLASLPPDANHPYGHGKAEHLSVGMEGGMILLAALAIIWEASLNLFTGTHRVQQLDIGFWLILSAAVINLLLGSFLLRVGRRTGSNILVADGWHVLSDVWTSLGVLLGLGLMTWVAEDRRTLVDSLVAIALALLIIVTAAKLLRSAIGGLLDEIDRKTLQRVVDAINEIREPTWIDVHALRLRSSGDIAHIDFHLTVPGDWSIAHAHIAEERLERHILDRLGMRGSVMVHLDYPHDGEHRPLPPPPGPPPPLTLAMATRMKDG